MLCRKNEKIIKNKGNDKERVDSKKKQLKTNKN